MAERADVTGPIGMGEELLGRPGPVLGLVLVADAVAAGLLAQVLAQELAVFRYPLGVPKTGRALHFGSDRCIPI